MDYDLMTKEQLIHLIQELESKRAFSYEDRMKLAILDNLPFTIWASDRDCIIRLWEGQCETMYGYKKNETLGKNYVELFVAPDERAAARRDHLKIIDENETFHNIANDQGRYGNVLRLITNCCRIIDPDKGDYLNAEMGVSIAYYEEEKQKLEENIAEGRRIQSFNKRFVLDQQQHREQFRERCNSLLDSIRRGKTDAAAHGRINEYKEKVAIIEKGILDAKQRFEELLLVFQLKISECVTHADCESAKRDYLDAHNEFLNDFSDIAIQFEIINAEFTTTDDLTVEKDEAMNATSMRNTKIAVIAQTVFNAAEREYAEYKALGTLSEPSEHLQLLSTYVDKAAILIEKISSTAAQIYKLIGAATTRDMISDIVAQMNNEYNNIENQLEQLRKDMNI